MLNRKDSPADCNCIVGHAFGKWSDLEYAWDDDWKQHRYCKVCHYAELRIINTKRLSKKGRSK